MQRGALLGILILVVVIAAIEQDESRQFIHSSSGLGAKILSKSRDRS